MKGIIYQLLEEVVTRQVGDDAWDALLESAGVEGAYTSLGTYPDEELTRLVEAASVALGEPPNGVVRWFGRNAMPLLAERFPGFFEGHRSTRSFLLTLNDVIHTEVRKLYPGADVPVFEFDPADDVLAMWYRSPRRLCALAEGLIEGAADHFGEFVAIDQPQCALRGDAACLLVCSFKRPGR